MFDLEACLTIAPPSNISTNRSEKIIMQQESLKKRTIKGTMWSAADAFLGQGVTFLVGLILARLLSPDEYGLIGICLIFTTVLNGVVDSGFSNALIRKNNVTDKDYNTMFLTNMLISIILYIILFFTSPFISSFFNSNELTPLLRTTGLVLLFNGLTPVQQTILTKRIDFKAKTKASVVSSVISGISGIVLAYIGFGVWALVVQVVSRQFLYSVSIFIINRWIPALIFSRSSFKYLWGFGWKLLVSGLLNNIWNQFNQIVVGRFYSPASLGQFTRSQQFAALFSENFSGIIQRVSLPVLSSIQDEKERLVYVYRRIIKQTMFISIIIMFSLAAVSEPFVLTIIGPQWHEAATYLPLISISLCWYPLNALNLNMLQILGRSDIFLCLEIVKKALAIVPILIGIFISIYWMLIASACLGFVSFILNSWYTGKKLQYNSWQQLCDIKPSFFIGLSIAIPIYFVKYLPVDSMFLILAIQILMGIVIFFFISTLSKNTEYKELLAILKSLMIR